MIQGNDKVLLHLSLISGVGPGTVLRLVKAVFDQTFPDLRGSDLMEIINQQDSFNLGLVYDLSPFDLGKMIGLSEKAAKTLADGLADQSLLDEECALIKKHDVALVTLFNPEYPETLKQIHLPPVVLYVKGASLAPAAKRIAIVGSRKATDYAHRTVQYLVPALVANQWHIVSGGAEGADTMAHGASLDCGGVTVAVLGSGLLCPYPASNERLFEDIARSGGSVISSFPMTMPPDRGNFPARNRIIAGLSQGCLIIQAAEKSGALITAQFALENGRQVFAVPGSIYEELSLGCHSLIKQGAKLVQNPQDIFEEFSEHFSKQMFIGAAAFRKADQQQSLNFSSTAELDPILAALSRACTLDELCAMTGFSIVELQNRLFELQLEGKVTQHFTGNWEKI